MGSRTLAASRRAFTLIEVLVVIAIISILSGIVFAVTRNAVESAHTTTCLSNLKQLGLAMNLYANDADDATPGGSPFYLGPNRNLVFSTSLGWAGKIEPYTKSAAIFKCSDDSSTPNTQFTLPGSQTISYAANSNALPKTLTSVSGSRTITLFEVADSFAQVTKVDEGMTPRPTQSEKVSAIGNGIKGSLLETFVIYPYNRPGDISFATGRLDNSDNDIFHDDFIESSRHRSGANYLLIDGHAAWASPLAVSAGSDAKLAGASQSSTGCFIWPATKGTDLPCAEGTQATGHKLTFSSI